MQSYKKKLLSDQRGFTLLEMLIVVSIAGVLAAVAVPRFNNAIMLANTARVQSDLQVLNSAIVLYQAEKGEYPTAVSQLGDYVQDIGNVRPPKGKCSLRKEAAIDVNDDVYGISNGEATCQGKKLSEFGRKEN